MTLGAAPPLRRAAAGAFLVLVATLPWTIAPMSIALAACGTLTLIVWMAGGENGALPRPILWPTLGWIAALLIASAFAEDRGASLSRVGKGFLPLLVGVAAYHGGQRRGVRPALAVLLASASVAAGVGLLMWIARGAQYPERAHGAVGHYMTFAGQLLLWLPAACAITLSRAHRRWRVAAAAAAVVGAATLAATFTRSAWIGCFVALVVVTAVSRPRGLLVLALALAVAVVVAPPAYRDRLASALDPGHATNVERRHMWSAGVRMFLDHPITGVGLQDLHAAYDRYRPPEAREPAGHLHNVYVQIAATMGVVGLLAFAWLYSTLLRMAARTLRARRGRDLESALQLGVTASLVGFLIAGMFEWNFGDEELLDLLYTLVGLAWVGGTRGSPEA